MASLAVLVAALMAAAEVRFKLTKTWRFVDAGPGRLALLADVVAALGVAFFAAGVSCLAAPAAAVVAALVGEVATFLSAGCLAAPDLDSSLSAGSSFTSFSLFFSLKNACLDQYKKVITVGL